MEKGQKESVIDIWMIQANILVPEQWTVTNSLLEIASHLLILTETFFSIPHFQYFYFIVSVKESELFICIWIAPVF